MAGLCVYHRPVIPTAGITRPPATIGIAHDQAARLLAREGVRFIEGNIPLDRFQWCPRVR